MWSGAWEGSVEGWSLPVLGKQSRLKALQWSRQQGAPPEVQQRRQVHRQLQAVAWRLDLCGSWRVSQSFPSWRRLQDEGIFQERGTSNTESFIEELGLRSAGMADHNSYSLSRAEGK